MLQDHTKLDDLWFESVTIWKWRRPFWTEGNVLYVSNPWESTLCQALIVALGGPGFTLWYRGHRNKINSKQINFSDDFLQWSLLKIMRVIWLGQRSVVGKHFMRWPEASLKSWCVSRCQADERTVLQRHGNLPASKGSRSPRSEFEK